MKIRSIAVALACAGCATTPASSSRGGAPDLTRPEGGLLVGLTSSSSDPRPQADAFAAFVQEATGQPTRAVVFGDYDGLARAIAEGKVDAAFLSPLAYVRALEQGKVEAVLRATRDGRDTYRAVLFARREAALTGLPALKKARNLRAAWVDPSSATGYVFPKALLMLNGINPAGLFVAQDFHGSHDTVCRAVAEGRADVGATFINDPQSDRVEGCQAALGDAAGRLAIVASTDAIPNDVLVVRAGFPEEAKGRLLIGATMLNGSPDGQRTLELAFSADGFAKVARDDYEIVRRTVQVFRP